jgi:hypothetical protein
MKGHCSNVNNHYTKSRRGEEEKTNFLQEIIVNSTKRTKNIHDKREQRIVVVDLRESGTQN